MDLAEAEDIKRWQEYPEDLYKKKDLHDPDNHNGVRRQVGLRKYHYEQS